MGNLNENISQAISDFDDIEKAIEEKGVNVPYDTDTSEYGDLIRSIPQSGGETQPPFVFGCSIEITSDGEISVYDFANYDDVAFAFSSGRTVIAQTQISNVESGGRMRTANLICLGEKGNYYPPSFTKIPYIFKGVTTLNEIVTIECGKYMSTDSWTVSMVELASAENVNSAISSCFRFEEGYENLIDTYTGTVLGQWYNINPPQTDEIYLTWEYYYIFAKTMSDGTFIQLKFSENSNGIYFRTGTREFGGYLPSLPSFDGNESGGYTYNWSEWSRTLLSSDVETTPTENSTKLITSGGVYNALQNIPSSGGGEAVTQPHYIFDAYLTITDGKLRVDSFESVENITEAFNSGRMVIAQTQMQYLDADENLITVDLSCLIATSPYTFFGVTSKSDHIFIEYGGSWIGSVSEAVSKNYVDTAIGNIEASLENIINKYGLGGEA